MNNKIKILITLVCCLALIFILFILFNPFKKVTALDDLRYIGVSSGRLMERHLEFYENYQETYAFERVLHQFLFGDQTHVQNQAIQAYEEVLSHFDAFPQDTPAWDILNTKSRWLITIAEKKDTAALREALKEFTNNPEEEVIAEAVKFAYLTEEHNTFSPEIFTGATIIANGWAKDRLQLKINTRLNKPYFVNLYSQRLNNNGKRLRQNLLHLVISVSLVIIIGLFVILRYRPFYTPSPWQSGIMQKPWSFHDGLFICSIAAVLGLVIWVTPHLLSRTFFQPSVFTMWTTLFASIPMLWLMHKYLLAPRGFSLISAFGLKIKLNEIPRFISITLSLLALELTGLLIIGWGTWQLGVETHWSSGIHERLIFGPIETVILSSINILLWAPILEEIGFRGLLYTTLRQRLTPTLAIVISAIIFSLLHLKSISGFLSIFWSGLILAYAYERYRSLLPGIAIHSIGNLMYLSVILLFYR